MVVTIWVIITLTFFLLRLLPGDPTSLLLTQDISIEAQKMIRAQWGLDKPLYTQYLVYVGNLIQFKFGTSIHYQLPVWEVLLPKLINTLILMGTSIFLAVLIAGIGGAYLGWKRGINYEKGAIILILCLRSIPIFWLGVLLLMVFCYWLRLVPGGGMHGTGFVAKNFVENYFSADFLKHLLLPFLCSLLYNVGDPLMIMRSSMLEVKGEDFLTLLEAKGLSRFHVMKQCARNAILPLITYTGVLVGYAFSGQVLLEIVFSWPGIGREIVSAVFMRDYAILQGSFVIMAFVVVLMNFIVDLSYGFLDPRIQYK